MGCARVDKWAGLSKTIVRLIKTIQKISDYFDYILKLQNIVK